MIIQPKDMSTAHHQNREDYLLRLVNEIRRIVHFNGVSKELEAPRSIGLWISDVDITREVF